MRFLLFTVACIAVAPAANAADWIAVCYEKDSQYTQTIGGPGFFHITNNNGTYDTQKLVQSYYDGNILCGTPDSRAPRAMSEVAEVCADKTKKTISVMTLADDVGKKINPQNARTYCTARISVF